MFHEVSRNSYSIAAIFVEFTGVFSQLKIIGLDQRLLMHAGDHLQIPRILTRSNRSNPQAREHGVYQY